MSEGGPRRPGQRAADLLKQIRATWPLCRRSLAAGGRRNLLIIAVVALSLVFYALYVSFLDLTYRESAALVRPVQLPTGVDIVLYVPRGVAPADRQAVQTLYFLRDRQWAVLGQVATNAGAQHVLFTDAAAPIRLPGTLTSGGLPAAGECLLPAGLARAANLRIGDRLELLTLTGPGAPGPSAIPDDVTVAGLYDPCDSWFSFPYVALDAAEYAAIGLPTVAWLTANQTGDFPARAVKWLAARFVPSAVSSPYVAGRAELPLLLTAGTAHDWARDLQRAVYFPGGEALFLVYVFFAVGIFTLMLLAFLSRRRELAVMKTLGLTSVQVAILLYLEVLVVAAAGLAAGGLTLFVGLPFLRTLTGQDLRLPAWIWASGAVFSLLALLVSVWLPIGMARLATVANLLGGQPFHLAGYERRWGSADAEAQEERSYRRTPLGR